ncbi:hypothetical protein N0S44_000386 [Escherichia coli]|nr:hypothetical protein [Escherichia coli]EJR1979231.1 hypothetical protein [Escherichia coli]UTS53692.1 hypothetical protein UES1_324 [Escherichia phage UE-S1]
MSLERALEIAKLIDLCSKEIVSNCLNGYLFKEGKSYCRMRYDDSSEYIHMYEEDLDDSEITLNGCDVNLEDNYIYFSRGADILIQETSIQHVNPDVYLPYSVLDNDWGSEEVYFQHNTIYDEDVLDKLVILWYFKNTDTPNFYMDLDLLRVIKEDI